jgi:hypothetical protein
MSAASARALRTVALVEERKLWRRDGATSMTSWLAGRYGLAWGTAREWVRVAHALEGLSRITEAYASGKLSWDQLRPLTRFATPQTDRRWAERGPELRPASLWREARRHERVRAREAEEARRTRHLRLDWDHERSVLWLEGMLPAEEGTALQAAVLQRAEALPRDPDADDPAAARLAGGLVDLATGGPEPATVVVHAGADVLAREEAETGPWLAETEGGQRLASGRPPAGLRREDRVGPRVRGSSGGDRPARTSGPRPAPPGAPAAGRRGLPVPGMRAEAVAPRPPPGPLGERRRHQPRQPGAAVPRAPPTHPRGRLADQRPSGPGPPVPRSGRATDPDRPAPTAAGGWEPSIIRRTWPVDTCSPRSP